MRGEENICQTGYTGTIVHKNAVGGFSSAMRVDLDFAFPIPDDLPSEAAAPLLCAGVTVYAPLRRAVQPGMRVAVVGVGGLGHLAVQFAAALGGVVTGIDIDPSKEAEVLGFNASAFFSSKELQESPERFKGAFDVLLNTTPVLLDVAALLETLKPNGQLIQLGIPKGQPIMPVPLHPLVFAQKHVTGSIVGGRAVTLEMLRRDDCGGLS